MLPTPINLKSIEDMVRTHWEKARIPSIVRAKISRSEKVGYVEGPPTMNGEPHMGHVRGRIIKDLWYRFQVLKGANVVFKAGWDTQGLPVELQAEKELGLTGSKHENLQKVGLESLVRTCKNLVMNYNAKWVAADRLLGMSFDYEEAYWTYKDEYIEREWMYLKKAYEAGLLGEGFRVVAFCPSCQTSLSHAEVAQGYEVVQDPSVYFKMKLHDEDAYLILWTTMPFTVVTDQMVGVKPDAEYCYLRYGGERWIVASERLEELMKELRAENYEVEDRIRGSSLEGRKYVHPLLKHIRGLQSLSSEKNVHVVVAEEFVDTTTGTGLVHLSPANGEEDFEVARRRHVQVFNPIDEKVSFTEEAGVFSGMFVRDADTKVIGMLKEEGGLVKASNINHEYPTCWRSHHKLVWLARREYFYWVDKLGEAAVVAAEKVEYFYEAPRNRFLETVKEKVPWCISRERVWGTPLPIWVCGDCDAKEAVFSREEIVKKAVELPDGAGFELHRPWIDKVVLKCSKCGGRAFREPFVLDTWHNSGAAPYASFTDDEFTNLVPVVFLTEGIDQTRGWAYTLLIENILLTGQPQAPYKAFLFQGHVLDEKGNKMSKSLGNIVDAYELLRGNPVDLVRFYMMWKASPIDNLNFSLSEMKSRPYQVINTLYNLHSYFLQNSSYDGFNLGTHTLSWATTKALLTNREKWLLSRLQRSIEWITDAYEKCRFHEAARQIEEFVIEDLSQSYVPMTRSEIWDDSPETLERRLAIYSTLAEVLKTICLLIHPIAPFMSEYLNINCFDSKKSSVLLEDWPKPDSRSKDETLEKQMNLVFKMVSASNAARMKAKLKRRWPLAEARFLLPEKADLTDHLQTICELANVKNIVFSDKISELPLEAKVSLNLNAISLDLKREARDIAMALSSLTSSSITEQLRKNGSIDVEVGLKKIRLSASDLKFEYVSKGDFEVSEKDGVFVAISTIRNGELIAEGLMRDVARRVQALRKELGYRPTEILLSASVSGLEKDWHEMLTPRLKELASLVRVNKVSLDEEEVTSSGWRDVEVDGRRLKIKIG